MTRGVNIMSLYYSFQAEVSKIIVSDLISSLRNVKNRLDSAELLDIVLELLCKHGLCIIPGKIQAVVVSIHEMSAVMTFYLETIAVEVYLYIEDDRGFVKYYVKPIQMCPGDM